jgi:LDH2 family malate/lactate/ureidoglycolate dehydrogenase
MEIAIKKAADTGVGIVTAGNGRHLGMASYHAMMALKHDMIGTCMTNAGPSVLPTFGSEKRLGTNPIAVAAPAGKEAPFVFDVATSVVAGNKIGLARRLGADLHGGMIADAEGTPIMETGLVPEQYALLPLGSDRELGSHKGYGLACVVDILAGILSGTGFGMLIGNGYNNHFLAAYNIEAFSPVSEFKQMMDEFIQTLKTTPPAPGQEKVIVAGQPEWETEQERSKNGIPLHHEVVEWFQGICNELEVPFTL